MQTNVIDIIVYLARQLNSGVDIQEIDDKEFNAYNKAEISAAYSWIIQNYGTSDVSDESKPQKENIIPTNGTHFNSNQQNDHSSPMELPNFMQEDYDPIRNDFEKGGKSHPQRILHPAEKMILPTESYGYLLELHHIGLINQEQLELIIERIMLNHDESVGIDRLKNLVVEIVFGDPKFGGNEDGDYLDGNETIH